MLISTLKTLPALFAAIQLKPQIKEYENTNFPNMKKNMAISFELPEGMEISSVILECFSKNDNNLKEQRLFSDYFFISQFGYPYGEILIPLGKKNITTKKDLETAYLEDLNAIGVDSERKLLSFKIGLAQLREYIFRVEYDGVDNMDFFKETVQQHFLPIFFKSSEELGEMEKYCKEAIASVYCFYQFYIFYELFCEDDEYFKPITINGVEKNGNDILTVIKKSVSESIDCFKVEYEKKTNKYSISARKIYTTINMKIPEKLGINFTKLEDAEEWLDKFIPLFKRSLLSILKNIIDSLKDNDSSLNAKFIPHCEYSMNKALDLLNLLFSCGTDFNKMHNVFETYINGHYPNTEFFIIKNSVPSKLLYQFPFLRTPCNDQLVLLNFLKKPESYFQLHFEYDSQFTQAWVDSKPFIFNTETNELEEYVNKKNPQQDKVSNEHLQIEKEVKTEGEIEGAEKTNKEENEEKKEGENGEKKKEEKENEEEKGTKEGNEMKDDKLSIETSKIAVKVTDTTLLYSSPVTSTNQPNYSEEAEKKKEEKEDRKRKKREMPRKAKYIADQRAEEAAKKIREEKNEAAKMKKEAEKREKEKAFMKEIQEKERKIFLVEICVSSGAITIILLLLVSSAVLVYTS